VKSLYLQKSCSLIRSLSYNFPKQIHFCFIIFSSFVFFFGGSGVWTQGLFLGRCSITWATPSTLTIFFSKLASFWEVNWISEKLDEEWKELFSFHHYAKQWIHRYTLMWECQSKTEWIKEDRGDTSVLKTRDFECMSSNQTCSENRWQPHKMSR
jgi:hypothetical protein